MKKPWTIAASVAIVVAAGILVFHSARKASSSPEEVVFELRYRGLTGIADKLNYQRAWGNGDVPEESTPFVQAVTQRVREYDLIHDAKLRNGDWSVVELQDKKAVALYFDLDANGELSDNERILPTPLPPQIGDIDTQFVTPDFMIHQEDDREIPFRAVILHVSGSSKEYHWTPGCILEAEATFAGEPMRLLLYGDRLTGSFTTFGRCSFAIIPAGREPELSFPLPVLSSLICHEGAFYRLQFDGVHEKGKSLRLTITRDTSPTGRAAIHLNAEEPLKIRPDAVTITGAGDNSIQFSLSDVQSLLPVGEYRLSSGRILYGVESDDQWQMTFTEGPAFAILQDQIVDVELGEPTLGIRAIAEDEIGKGRIREEPVYAGDTLIYLSRQIRGKAGEAYGKFSQKSVLDNQWIDVKPHVAILDPEGKEAASGDMEYG